MPRNGQKTSKVPPRYEVWPILSGQSLVTQQGIQRGFAAPEGLEGVQGGPAAARFEDRLAVPAPGLHARHAVRFGRLLEGGVRVGAEDFRPLVAVVARGIAA